MNFAISGYSTCVQHITYETLTLTLLLSWIPIRKS